jgi:hypothetical protein
MVTQRHKNFFHRRDTEDAEKSCFLPLRLTGQSETGDVYVLPAKKSPAEASDLYFETLQL